MDKATAKSREVAARIYQNSSLSSSMISLSGFRICQLAKRESPDKPLTGQKTSKKPFYPKEKK